MILCRFIIRKDREAVVELSNGKLTMESLRELFSTGNIVGTAAEENDKIFGFMIHKLEEQHVEVLHFFYSTQDVAMALLNKLKDKLSLEKRHRISICVKDTDLESHLLLCREKFIAGVESEDTYRFDFYCDG